MAEPVRKMLRSENDAAGLIPGIVNSDFLGLHIYNFFVTVFTQFLVFSDIEENW